FHDIAKGRGGSHAELGAKDAFTFCQRHQLSNYDSKLVQWLVLNHLVMSSTAQKKDISDPEVIHEFATKVGGIDRLNYIYLLTVADIRATGPNVWNSWKDALLKDLYNATKRALRRGLDDPILASEHIEDTISDAIQALTKAGFDEHKVKSLWQDFDVEYFLRHSANEVAWQTRAILGEKKKNSAPILLVRNREHRGGTEIFIYVKNHDKILAHVTSILEQLSLTIVDARILISNNDYLLGSFVVLDENDEAVKDTTRITELKKRIKQRLSKPDSDLPPLQQHIPRQTKAFKFKSDIQFWVDEKNSRTAMQISTVDRPGVLSRIARVLMHCELQLHNAKIATYGERAEDIFYITNSRGKMLETDGQFKCIKDAIHKYLDSSN
ncbi:MAG: [protein-PII] uridylyltransferase, partial [Thioalkalispiraceae bacterium]